MDYVLFGLGMLMLGAGVGVVSAALGIGGGVLMVPAFIHFIDGMDMNTAKGSSLFIIVLVAAYNSWKMNRNESRNPWDVVLFVAAGSIVGGYLGAWLTTLISDEAVTWLFVLFILLAAVRTFFLEPPEVSDSEVRSRRGLSTLIGSITGIFSGATGTGGGSVLVPLSLWSGIASNERVVALSNTVMVATCAAGVAAHALAPTTVEIPGTYGLVNFAVAPLVFLGAMLSAPLGRRLNARMDLRVRRIVMGVLLLVIALRLVARAMG